MAGTGDQAFAIDKDLWLQKIAEAAKVEGSKIKSISIPEPGFGGVYGAGETKGSKDEEVLAKMEILKGMLHGYDIKTDSGEVTSESGEDQQANTCSVKFLIDNNTMDWNEAARVLKQKNFGFVIPDPNGGYFVVLSPVKTAKLNNAFTSGTTWDSEHGHTATVSAAPCTYAECHWYPGADVENLDTAKCDDLKTWCEDFGA